MVMTLELRARLAVLAQEESAAATRWLFDHGHYEEIVAVATGELDVSGLYSAAVEIARERKEKLLRLRDALVANDLKAVTAIARQLCGLGDSREKSNRTHSRIH